MLKLQRQAGNVAVGTLLQRDKAGARSQAKIDAARTEQRDELERTSAWILYLSRRDRTGLKKPETLPPVRYIALTKFLPDAFEGTAEPLVKKAVAQATALISQFETELKKSAPTMKMTAVNVGRIALERALENAKPGNVLGFKGGATELDDFQIVNKITNEAGDEVEEAKKAGYQVPPTLIAARDSANERREILIDRYRNGARSDHTIEAVAEHDLVEMVKEVRDEVNSMRALRAADLARAHAREARALEDAAEERLASLNLAIADRRKSAFAAGEKGLLEKAFGAISAVKDAVDDMKGAAAIITDRVDLLNDAAKAVGHQKLVSLPDLPGAFSKSIEAVEKAHGKLETVIKVLDLLGPAKTEFDQGIKYLKGIDLAMSGLADKVPNPIFGPYVSKYLGPGIDACIRGMGLIADKYREQNRGQIESGDTILVNWTVEQGGEPVYLYMRQLFKSGAVTPMSAAAWSYFRSHRAEFVAAAGDKMPDSQRSVSTWAYPHRTEIWQALYGSIRAPRE
ncbi:MAG TPA: hypothetical protein VM143_15865 [Acidimicrobiales bacterium]|nr:hypothetical protein [Acidimicrobiales bacterium]